MQDDDLEQSPERESVSVALVEDELPPGLQFEGGGYVDANGEARIRGTIQPHGDANPTKYFYPRFRARDWRGAEDMSDFVQVGATDLRVNQVEIVGLSSDANNRTSIKGFGEQNKYKFDIKIKGVGSPAGGGQGIVWSLKDKKTGKYLYTNVYAAVPAGQGAQGQWELSIKNMWIYVNNAGNIEGLERAVGQEADLVVEVYSYSVNLLLMRRFLGESGTYYVTAR
ncbi:hypothetical protein HRbin36_00307 [bacterium HR36]|nr:hypothetical protein HRbin36_00307 [bacterium HR36]